MTEPIELEWGQTPWDSLSREELLREVERMYSAIVALNSCLAMSKSASSANSFWGHEGSGGIALEKARQVLGPLHAKFDREDIYRSFFRYANDLLFNPTGYRIGSGWSVCPVCDVMLGNTRHPDGTEETQNGKVCHFTAGCTGIMRPLEWADLAPRPEPA